MSNIKAREWYWVPHPSRVWVAVLVQSISKNSCWVTTVEDDQGFELDITECPFLPLNPRTVDDMTSLLYLHEAGILENLYERSKPQNQRPYTYVSNVLIAINPLRNILSLPMESYKDKPICSSEPHPFGISELAYQQMTLQSTKIKNQSIVISGESGAGKTETAKIVLRYLCWRASGGSRRNSLAPGQMTSTTARRGKEFSTSLDKRLLDTNPILEAFGNAKTLRNANSSRFGKLFKLQFDPARNHQLVSAGLDTYLLEKSRVTCFSEGERNYHVFYQLLSGASPAERKKWQLKEMNQYHYINQSSELTIADVDDKALFAVLSASMLSVGISTVEQDIIYRVLSAVLTLGNTTFRETEVARVDILLFLQLIVVGVDGQVASGEAVEISEPYIITKAAEMLGISKEMLESIVTSRTLDMTASSTTRRASSYRIPLDVTQALYARDAVAKSIYKMVFDFIVKKISVSLQPEGIDGSPLPCIGVLDIFGFECFAENGLEQLLINYANESLQLTFNRAVLEAEQQMYIEEGMQVKLVEFVDNSSCVEMIARSKNSILATLDSVCKAPKPTEDKFNTHVHQIHEHHACFPKIPMVYKRNSFLIQHYAQTVMYTVGTFIPKNMDTVPNELMMTLASSVHSQKCAVLSPDIHDDNDDAVMHHIDRSSMTFQSQGNPLMNRDKTPPPPFVQDASSEQDDSVGGTGAGAGSGAGDEYFSSEMKKKLLSYQVPAGVPVRPPPARPVINRKGRNETVGSTFVRQMSALCNHLESTNCTFIRCIKPNSTMSPGIFDHKFVMEQVRVLGIIQTCEVLKHGMPARLTFTEIESMYRSRFPDRQKKIIQSLAAAEFALAVADTLHIPKENFQLGRTRVFFTSSNLSAMDKIASVDMSSAEGNELVAGVVSYHIRKVWSRALTKVLTQIRFCLQLKACREKNYAAAVLQCAWRAYVCSSQYQRRLTWRKLWKRSIYHTIACNILLENYTLIKEANEMRTRAEAAAEENMRLLRERESEESNRRRGRSVSGSGILPGLARSDSTGGRLPSLLETADGDDAYTEESEIDLIIADDAAKAKAEMRALVVASSLATVSVCLFRWTKIRVFQAFEKWHEVCFLDEDELAAGGNGRRARVLSMLQRTKIGPGGGGREGLNDDVDDGRGLSVRQTITDGISGQSKHSKDASAIKCFECQQRTAQAWCDNCFQGYCTVCCQFVHSSCRMMKLHIIQHISKSPSHQPGGLATWPVHLTGHAVSSAMSDVVSALAYESSDVMLPGSARQLYFSRRRNNTAGYKTTGDERHDWQDLDHGSDLQTRARRGTISGTTPARGRRARASIMGGMGFSRMGSSDNVDKTKTACAIKSCSKEACKGISIRFCEEHYEEFRRTMKGGGFGGADDEDGTSEHVTLQQQVALLKKQLQDSGQEPVEFVELAVARQRMQEAVQRLMGGDEAAEKEIEKWDKAIRMNPEYQKELEENARKWEEAQRDKNLECLRRTREFVPPDIRQTSVNKMITDGLPKSIATRVWTKKALWCTRMHPDDIRKIHIADLRTKFGNQGLDIIEMRAIYASLPIDFDNDGDGKKVHYVSNHPHPCLLAEWRNFFRQKLEELTVKESSNRLSNPEKRNSAYKGHEELIIYDPDAAIVVSLVQKSAAFDATELPELGVGDGGGVKKLQSNLFSVPSHHSDHGDPADTSNSAGPRVIGKLKTGRWDTGGEVGGGKTSKAIAEAAAAAEEEERAIARGSYIVPTANPLLDKMKKRAQAGDSSRGVSHQQFDDMTSPRATMTLQQTLQSVQYLTQRAHANKDGKEEGRDNAARLANAGIYNTAKGALHLHTRKGGAVRRRKSHSPPRRKADDRLEAISEQPAASDCGGGNSDEDN